MALGEEERSMSEWKVLIVPTGSDDKTAKKEIFSGDQEAAQNFYEEATMNGFYTDADEDEQYLEGGLVLVDSTGAVAWACS